MKPSGPTIDGSVTTRHRPPCWVVLEWVALVMLNLLSAQAQDAVSASDLEKLKGLDLDQLLQVQVATVTAASGFEQTVTEAPSSISIITSDEIKRYGYRTLADILQSLQGFNVSNDRNSAFLGTRGVGLGDFNSRMLLLVDGHRINNNLTDGAAIGTDFILDVDLIDRVEVIRGPGSVLYGNNAFFGVINVVTRKGGQVNVAEASGEYGSFDTYKARVSVGKSFTNGLEFLVSGTYYTSDGPDELFFKEFNTPDQNNGIARNMNGNSFESAFGSLQYADFTLEGAYIHRENVNPTAQNFTTFNDPRSNTTDDRSYVDLKYAHDFIDVVNVLAHVYYDRNNFQIGYPLGQPTAAAVFHETQEGEWWGAELQLSKRLWQKHSISIGADYRDDFYQYDHVYGNHTTFTENQASQQSYGVFAQTDIELRHDLHFSGGVRYDQYGDFDPTVSPRLALIYTPFERSAFKAIYGTAFRSPNFLELSDPRFQNIEQEQITSYELIYEQGIGQHLRSSVEGFYNELDNLIFYQDGHYENVNADSRGMELALEGNWANGVIGRTSYTLQKTENESGGLEFPNSPEQLFKFNLSVPVLRDKIFAGLEYQYTSSRATVYTSNSGATESGPDTSSFGVMNFTLFSQKLVKNLEFSASVYNLLDTSYSDPASRNHVEPKIPQDGRTFRIKLTYKF